MTSPDIPFSYDSVADGYAAAIDHAPYNALYERPAMLGLLPPVDGRRILEAGCGAGWYTEQLLARGARVSAVDASAALVEHTRRRIAMLAPEARERFGMARSQLQRAARCTLAGDRVARIEFRFGQDHPRDRIMRRAFHLLSCELAVVAHAVSAPRVMR